ncbi:MAG TPA: beta-aspartyl-peptidase [Dokdonella sp.]|uniref:beta-aspartyl-peptidase n=1 Tax=Dokdonella sp. TaxID=2291710 RepID=UPI002D7E301D|nr:beta-aspartyl-peptidase [Dokdonella sp.]HET9031497.1 beta-aspartyl-peptidase [Dokdonella sp.]
MAPSNPQPMILLRNAEVFAPQAIGRQNLLIGGGRVLGMSTAAIDSPLGIDVEEVDLHGQRLLPGFIDGHVHVTGGGGEGGFATRISPLPLSRYTHGGVTSVIGLLGTDDCARSTRELVANLLALREQGLGAWGYCGGYHLPPTTLTGSVRGDIAFIDPLIGVGELAISDHRSSQPTLDELLRIASEAHVAGLMSGKAGIVHLHLGDGERGLDLVRRALAQSEIPARVFNPTHINRRRALFDEALELATQGCHVDITAFPVEDGEDAWSAADALQRYLDSAAPKQRITISSDAGGCLPCFDSEGQLSHMDVGTPGALLATLVELLDHGLLLDQVLPAFTSNVAALLRLPRKGVIEVGGDADLLVLDDANGLSDVLLGGDWHLREGKSLRRGVFEPLPSPTHSQDGSH